MKAGAGLLLCLLLGCAAAQPPRAAPPRPAPSWSMEGGGPGRASFTTVSPPTRWEPERITRLVEREGYEPEAYGTPVVVGRLAFVGTAAREVLAVDWRSGAVVWRFPMRGRVFGSLALDGGLLFAADDQGDLVALSLEGVEAWRFHVSYPVVTSPVAAAGRVYVGVTDQNVFCLEAATGRPLWQYGRKFPRRTSLWRTPGLAAGDGRVYAGFADGSVVALDAEVGRVVWRAEIARDALFGDVCAGPTYRDGRVYAGALKGPVVCLEAATGKELWRQTVEAASGFAVGDDLLVLGEASGEVTALRRGDGTRVWRTPLDGGVPSAPLLAGDRVVAGASRGSLYSLDAASGAERGRYAPGSGVGAQPAVFDGGLLFLSNGGALFWMAGAH